MQTTRELYKEKYDAQLREWSAKIEALSAHTDKLTAQAKLDMKPHHDSLRAKLDAAKSRLHDAAEATEEKWDDAAKSADHAWNDVKAAIDGAYEAIKKHAKS